jgi:hypothetical protein
MPNMETEFCSFIIYMMGNSPLGVDWRKWLPRMIDEFQHDVFLRRRAYSPTAYLSLVFLPFK